MSTRARTRARLPNFAGDAIREARNLVGSSSEANIKQVWEKLCQHHLRDLRAGRINDKFPYWVLHNIAGHIIEQLIKTVYGKGAGKIGTYYPSLCKNFDVPEWQFNLFLGYLPQSKARVLFDVTRDRTDVTLDDLYQRLCRIRSQTEALPNGPLNFTGKEIKCCFSDSDSENEYEDHFDDDSEDDDVFCATEGSEDDYRCDNVHNTVDSFDDNFNDPVNHNSSQGSPSSVMDVLDRHATSPIHTTSSTLIANAAPCAIDIQRSSTVDTATLIAGQLDSDRQKQAVDVEEHGANRSLSRELMADVLDYTGANTQQQTICPNSTDDIRLAELRNSSNRLARSIDSLERLHEELHQDRLAIVREESEVSADINAESQAIQDLVKPRLTRERNETIKAKILRLVALCEKRDIIENKHQEYQAKRRKYDADIDDLNNKRVESFRGSGLDETN